MQRRLAIVALVAFVGLGLVELVAELADAGSVAWLARALLMPLLACFCWLTCRPSRLVILVLIALGFSWLGDVSGALLTKIILFLGAQIAYVAAFWPFWRRTLAARPALLTLYALAIMGLIIMAARAAGPLVVPVIAYGVSLALMAVLATGVSRSTGLGGVLFLVSDIVLAVEFFVRPGLIAHADAVNMALYLPAQLLIVLGVVGVQRALEAEEHPTVTAGLGR